MASFYSKTGQTLPNLESSSDQNPPTAKLTTTTSLVSTRSDSLARFPFLLHHSSMLTITPLGDKVLVQPLEKESTTASGIIIPDTATGEKPQQGKVIALGCGGIGKDNVNPQDFLKVGDTVLFGKYAGDDVVLKDDEGKSIPHKVLTLGAILGIVS